MTESNMTLASFNVDKEAWEQFKTLAKGGGWSASYGLNELIKQALQRQSISPIDSESVSMPDPDLSGYISKADFDKAIADLTKSLEKKSQPDPTATTELIKKQVSEAIANLPKPDPAALDTIKLDCQAIAQGEIRRALAELPQPEPVDIEAQVKALVQEEIKDLNKKVIKLMLNIDALKASSNGEVAAKNEVIPKSHPGQLSLLASEQVTKAIPVDEEGVKPDAQTIPKGLNGQQLADHFGLKSRSGVSDAITRGLDSFRKWSAKKDPDGCPWRWEGEGQARRFYRVDP